MILLWALFEDWNEMTLSFKPSSSSHWGAEVFAKRLSEEIACKCCPLHSFGCVGMFPLILTVTRIPIKDC